MSRSNTPVRRRSAFFGQQVIRLMTKTCLANEIGPAACYLLAVVSAQQDAAGGRPVTYYNDQLMPLIGIRRWHTLDAIRQACIDAGWLTYTNRGKRKSGLYAVVIPARFAHLTDSRCDEGTPVLSTENVDSCVDNSVYNTVYNTVEPPSSTSTSDSASALARSNPAKPSRKREPFEAPNLEQVQAYCRERSNAVDAQHFIDHYTSNGWRVGRNPMKDWRAAVRTWERNGISPKAPPPGGQPSQYADLAPRRRRTESSPNGEPAP